MCAWPIAESSWTCEPFRCGEERLQDRLGLVPGRAVVLDPHVAEAVELGEEPAGPRLVKPVHGVGLEPAQDVEVVVQVPGPAVEAGDPAAIEHDRLERRVGPRKLAELARCRPARRAGRAAPRRPPARGRARRSGRRPGSSSGPARGARRSRASPRCGSPRAGRPARPPTPPGRSPRPGTSTSPTAGRTARRARRRGTRAPRPPRRDAVDGPGDAQRVGIARVRMDQAADPLADLGDPVARVLGVALHGSRNPRWLRGSELDAHQRPRTQPARDAPRPPPGSTTAGAGPTTGAAASGRRSATSARP